MAFNRSRMFKTAHEIVKSRVLTGCGTYQERLSGALKYAYIIELVRSNFNPNPMEKVTDTIFQAMHKALDKLGLLDINGVEVYTGVRDKDLAKCVFISKVPELHNFRIACDILKQMTIGSTYFKNVKGDFSLFPVETGF